MIVLVLRIRGRSPRKMRVHWAGRCSVRRRGRGIGVPGGVGRGKCAEVINKTFERDWLAARGALDGWEEVG